MKYIKYTLVLFISLFFCMLNCNAAASNFEGFMSMDSDITENKIRVTLGFTGEEIMTIKGTVAYDSNKLSLVEVEALDNFNVTTSKEKSTGKYRTVEVLADSDYSFPESNYAVLVFEIKKEFKNRNKSDLFLYDYTASGPDKIKYRFKGVIATLNRLSASEMDFVLENIVDSTKNKYWLLNHVYIFVIIGISIIGVIGLIFLIPSRRKIEKREKTATESIKAENFVPNQNNVKIDLEAIDAIGKVEHPIDMTQAIIVNEDIKPFGDIVGKFDENEENKTEVQQEQPLNAFNTASKEEAPLPKVTGERVDTGTSVDGFDPFHAKIIPDNTEKLEPVETLEELPSLKQENKEQKDDTSELTVINPQNFESVELPKLNDDVKIEQPNSNNNPNNNSQKPNVFVFLFITLTLATFNIADVQAYDSIFKVNDLRDCIVGKIPYSKELDYNKDGTVDILDLIETKDLNNCSFKNLLKTDPGFAEVHGKSNNLISTDTNFVKPTKKGKRTTKPRTTKAK